MSQLFGFGVPVPQSAIPPPSPRIIDKPVQKAADDEARRPREGRASQFLTSPAFNAIPQVSREQRLGGFLS